MKRNFALFTFILLSMSSFAQYHWRCFYIYGETYSNSDIIETSDGGHLMNTNGFMGWADLEMTSDSGYVCLIKNIYSGFPPDYKMCLVKFDYSFNVQWVKGYSDSINFSLSNIREVNNGYLFSKGPTLIRTDHSGDTLWTSSYNLELDSAQFNRMSFAVDSPGLILSTNISVNSFNPEQQTIFKTDSSGIPIWTKRELSTATFEGFGQIFTDKNLGYKLYAQSALGGGAPNPCLVRTDVLGNFGCSVDTSMIQMRPNTINVTVDTIVDSVFTIISSTVVIIEEDTVFAQVDLCLLNEIANQTRKSGLSIYPNPATDFIYLKFDEPFTYILITDLEGRKVSEFNPTSIGSVIDISKFAQGIYFLTAVSKDEIQTRKIVVQF